MAMTGFCRSRIVALYFFWSPPAAPSFFAKATRTSALSFPSSSRHIGKRAHRSLAATPTYLRPVSGALSPPAVLLYAGTRYPIAKDAMTTSVFLCFLGKETQRQGRLIGFGPEMTNRILLLQGTLLFLVFLLDRMSIKSRGGFSCPAYTSFVTLVATSHGAG